MPYSYNLNITTTAVLTYSEGFSVGERHEPGLLLEQAVDESLEGVQALLVGLLVPGGSGLHGFIPSGIKR